MIFLLRPLGTKGHGRAGLRTGLLGRTYGRILDLSFGGPTENSREMVLESVSRGNLG
jgi:hypothetical protein